MKAIKKEKISEVLDYLAEQYRLFAPVSEDGLKFDFAEVKDADRVNLNFKNAHESPKKLFFPQYEVLFTYSADGQNKAPDLESKKQRVIFGLRPCDVKSLLLLDKVFDDAKYQDPYYLTKRKNTIIFSLGCNEPQSTCFCTSLGIGPYFKRGSDVFVTDLGDEYLFESLTETGADLLEKLPALHQASQEQISRSEALAAEAEEKIKKKIDLMGVPEELAKKFDDEIWDEIHQKCIRCGVCTFLCPTCHCFDIIDENQGKEGKRLRIWDSCMSADFTLEASGHNPRPGGRERMRQRVMHKFRYFPENFGEFACVGCGRCIKNCPVYNDITKIIEKVRKVKARKSK